MGIKNHVLQLKPSEQFFNNPIFICLSPYSSCFFKHLRMFVFKKIQEFRILIYCRDFLVETRLGKGYSVLYFDKSWGESIFKGQGFPILYLVWQQLQLRGYKRADCVGRTTHLPLFVFAKSTQPCLSCREPNLQPELRDRRRGVPRIERFLDFSHFNGYYIVHCSLIGLKLVTT